MPKSNVRRWNGVEISGTPSAGQVPVASSATAAAWGTASDLTNAVILAPSSSTRNIIEATGDYTALTIKMHGVQSTPLQLWTDNADNMVAAIDGTGPGGYPAPSTGTFHAKTSSGNAVLGESTGVGIGVAGYSVNGFGVYGESSTSYGIRGMSASSSSAYFASSSAANTEPTVAIRRAGTSTAHLLEFRNAADAVVSYIDKDGVPSWGTGAGTVTSITAGTGLTGGTITTAGTIAADVGTSAGQLLQLNGSAQIPAVDASLLTSLNGSNIASGTVAVAYLPAMVGDSGAGGTAGLVPAPAAGDAAKFLSGAGTWLTPPAGFTPGKANVVHLGAWTAYNTATPLTDAKTAAVSGDTIVVYPGTYSEAGLAKNGVNWHFEDGAIVDVFSGSTYVFGDGGSAIAYSVTGRGVFKTSGSYSALAFSLHQGASTVYFEAKQVTGIKPAFWMTNGTVTIHADRIDPTLSGYASLRCSGGIMYATVDLLDSPATGNGRAIDSTAGTMYVMAKTISGAASTGTIDISGGTLYVRADAITNSAVATVVRGDSGTSYISAHRIEQSSAFTGGAAVGLTSTSCYIDADLIKASGDAVTVPSGAADLHITARQITCTGSSSYYPIKVASGATSVYLRVDRAVHTGSNGVAMSLAASTVYVYGSLDLTSHSGATDSITAGGAVTLTNNGTITANKALNANVTVAGNTDGLFFTPGRLVTKTANYTILSSDQTVLANAAAGGFTVTLPTAVGRNGVTYTVKKIDTTGNAVTVATTSSQTIDGALTQVITTPWTSLSMTSNGANWFLTP